MKRALWIAVVAGLISWTGATESLAQQKGDTATYIFATYKCKPADRPALLRTIEGPGLAQFEDWKKRGVIGDYQLLFSSFVNDEGWDLLTLVSFDKYTQTAAWEAIEADLPGGLPREAQRLVEPVNEYLADLTWHGEAARPAARGKATYVVVPQEYEPFALRATYQLYMQSHELPVLQRMLDGGALASYRVFLNHHFSGRPWDALHVLEFRDLEGLTQRSRAQAQAEAGLASNDNWKVFVMNREKYQQKGRSIVADAILPR